MIPQMIIVKILKYKNKLIKKVTEISNYVNEKDLCEIKSWSNNRCRKIIEEMNNCYNTNSDSDICPWCIQKDIDNQSCQQCNYGKRHGECCGIDKNLYNDITNKLPYFNNNIYNIPNILSGIKKIIDDNYERNHNIIIGDKVKILREDIFHLKHRKNKNGIAVDIDGDYIYVKPMWCEWTIKLYPNEVELIKK